MEQLLPIVYGELRRLAGGYLRKERDGHTLVATELVHEAYLRLTDDVRLQLQNRSHLLALTARTMRRVLVDHARRQDASKRIGFADKVALDQAPELGVDDGVDVLEIHQAIEDLSAIHDRQAKVVELRYFGGLTTPEIAEVLDISEPTVARDWRIARLWLHRRLAAT